VEGRGHFPQGAAYVFCVHACVCFDARVLVCKIACVCVCDLCTCV
jgi:hypothetical protein